MSTNPRSRLSVVWGLLILLLAVDARGQQDVEVPHLIYDIRDFGRMWRSIPAERGREAFERGEYTQAITQCTVAIRLDPKNADAYNNRGRAYYAQGKYLLAIEDFSNAAKLEPSFVYFVNWGKAEKAAGISGKLLFEAALRKEPNHPEIWVLLAESQIKENDYARAIASCDEALRLKPNDVDALFKRGQAWIKLKDFVRALADIDEVIDSDPSADAYTLRGLAWQLQGEKQKAIAEYDQAIQLDPKSWMAYGFRGNSWHHLGDYVRALADLNRAIQLKPNEPDLYETRSRIWESLGNDTQRKLDLLEVQRILTEEIAAYDAEKAEVRAERESAMK